MTLVADRQLAASIPQTHALVIGVAAYPHLIGGVGPLASMTIGLGQLTSPVFSATAFAQWLDDELNNPAAPLGTVELLLSPGPYRPNGKAAVPVEPATHTNIQTAFDLWYDRCNAHADNVGIFYFCGHGIEPSNLVLLPEDFGVNANRPWESAIDFSSTFRAMADCKAVAQCYFLDACRERPLEALVQYGFAPQPLRSGGGNGGANRAAPVIKAAALESKAHAPANDKSYFTKALLDCLRGTAAEKTLGAGWRITTDSLGKAMTASMQRVKLPTGQRCACNPAGGEQNTTRAIHHFTKARVPVLVTVTCNPDAVLGEVDLLAADGKTTERRGVRRAEPWETVLESGSWDLDAKFDPGSVWQDAHQSQQLVQPPVLEVIIPINGRPPSTP